ncbi:MAG: hypothetical protein KIS67_18865 [Verrucomicrobiae bacterium]|nr:hypothetical protein [Verrucomicrobiae bacterium]
MLNNAVRKGIPVPAFSTTPAFVADIRSQRLPANLLQAQCGLLHLRCARSPLSRFSPRAKFRSQLPSPLRFSARTPASAWTSREG